MELTAMGLVAMSYLGVPYIWGGDNAISGLDCSGFIQKVLSQFSLGVVNLDPSGDQTAQGLYDKFSKNNLRITIGPDSILFFGDSRSNITHVALALNNEVMIEAAPGSHLCKTLEDAVRLEARVRIAPITRRKDLIAFFKLQYNLVKLF